MSVSTCGVSFNKSTSSATMKLKEYESSSVGNCRSSQDESPFRNLKLIMTHDETVSRISTISQKEELGSVFTGHG